MVRSHVNPAFAALVALLLAAPLTHAQQAPADAPTAKTKVKTKRGQAAPAAVPTAAQAGLAAGTPPPPPAGGPRPGNAFGALRPDGPGPGGPGGPGRPGPEGPGHPGAPKGGAQALTDFSGTLTEYTAANDEQVYDAFTLKTSTGTEAVRFPRHLGQALMAAAKAGSPVTVTGYRDTGRDGKATLHLVSLAAGSQTVRDTPPARPSTPPTEEATTVRGTISSLRQGPQGRTTGLLLSDGTVLHLPPAAAEQLAEKLKVGATVAATGTLRAPHPGEVAAKPIRAVRAQTITLDGVQFLVK